MNSISLAITISVVSLLLSIAALGLIFYIWQVKNRDQRRTKRLDLLRDLRNGFSDHNWKFIEHWNFSGISPPLSDLALGTPPTEKDVFGVRVVTLEHLNLLLKVFTHKDILTKEDIEGFANWTNSWFPGSVDALKLIFSTGDTYPLDFILWLKDEIVGESEFSPLIGSSLKQRLENHKSRNSKLRSILKIK